MFGSLLLPRSSALIAPYFAVALCALAECALAATPAEINFTRDVKPILARRCFACHGPETSEGGLRLDDPESATAELDSGMRAVVAGRPDESELVARITSDDDAMRMPLEE